MKAQMIEVTQYYVHPNMGLIADFRKLVYTSPMRASLKSHWYGISTCYTFLDLRNITF